jgi:hypothetical protein
LPGYLDRAEKLATTIFELEFLYGFLFYRHVCNLAQCTGNYSANITENE